MSFMRFLDLTIADDIPDSRTIWKFTEQITDLELTEPLFKRFEEELVKLNLIVNEGKIIDASFVEAPRQRNSKEENARIKKEGAAPKQWEESPEKLAQKDVDARWTKKNNQTYYGYKNHTKVDSESKLISNYLVTDASVHDSQALDQLLEEKDKGEQLYAWNDYRNNRRLLFNSQPKGAIFKTCHFRRVFCHYATFRKNNQALAMIKRFLGSFQQCIKTFGVFTVYTEMDSSKHITEYRYFGQRTLANINSVIGYATQYWYVQV
jgi:IS5 family transposase